MSKIKDFYLAQQERNQHLAAQQAEMDELAAGQVVNDEWYTEQDKDKEFQEHCDRLLSEPESKAFMDSLDNNKMPF